MLFPAFVDYISNTFSVYISYTSKNNFTQKNNHTVIKLRGHFISYGGDKRDRTADLLNAIRPKNGASSPFVQSLCVSSVNILPQKYIPLTILVHGTH